MNTDQFEIQKYELTKEGYLKLWMIAGVPDKVLDYGNRREIINKDSLFNPDSLNTVVGKPITLNHPPVAVISDNIQKYYRGVALQTMDADDDGNLVIPAIIHDDATIKGILSGKYKYVSSAYSADKALNSDGILEQTNRHYNHFAILDNDNKPRAGNQSKVLTDSMDNDMENKTDDVVILDDKAGGIVDKVTVDSTPQPTTQPTPQPNPPLPIQNTDSISEKVELLVKWKPILDEKGVTINYDSDVKSLKKSILSTSYPPETISLLNENNIDGFWLAFTMNTDSQNSKTSSQKLDNFDSILESELSKYIDKITGVK